MGRSKILWVFLIVAVFVLLGYFREFFFVHLNIIRYHKYYHNEPDYVGPTGMSFFLTLDYKTLYYLKYPFTLISVSAFFAANYLGLKKLSGNPFLIKILMYVYLVMFALAALSMAYGYVMHGRLQDDEYTLSRWLLGIAQSPIICLILLASEKLHKSTKHEEG